MPANNAIKVTDLDFDSIKSNLKDFLSNQKEFEDYNFESSTISTLLNLLSYNTYMNAFYTNMVMNEMYLDSAQIRSNIVSRAKMLGYTPRSARGSTADVAITINPLSVSGSYYTVNTSTTFSSKIDGVSYTWTPSETKLVNANPSGVFSTTLTIVQGTRLTHTFPAVDSSSSTTQKYVLPNAMVDTTSIVVKVQASSSNTSITTHTLASDLTNVTGNSNVYFLQEVEEDKYEIIFGDNILGKQLNDGNIVKVDYRVCDGVATNQANNFTTSSGAITNVETLTRSQGGGDPESLTSIKFNAPKNYQTQNRAVTVSDYRNLILNNFADIKSVSVWGGEENTPPDYGRVYIAMKPRSSLKASYSKKLEVETFLENKTVLAIEPVFVDPSILYVKPTVTVKYNPDLTALTSDQLIQVLSTQVISYEDVDLGEFKQNYLNSVFTNRLQRANESIVSVQVELLCEKSFVPDTERTVTYSVNFNNEIHNYGDVIKPFNVSSSQFTYQGFPCFLDDDGYGNLRIYTKGTTGRIYKNTKAGTVDYKTGLIRLESVLIEGFVGTDLKIVMDPDKFDIETVRNQVLLLKDVKIDLFNLNENKVVASVSDISTQGETTTISENAVLATIY